MAGGGVLHKMGKDILKIELSKYKLTADNVSDILIKTLNVYEKQFAKASEIERKLLIHICGRIRYYLYLEYDRETEKGKRRKGKETMALVFYLLNK